MMWVDRLDKLALWLLSASQALLAAAVLMWRSARRSVIAAALAVLMLAASIGLILYTISYFGF